MNYDPLLRIRSWNNGVRYLTFYILSFFWIWTSGLAFGISVPPTTNALHSNQWVSLYKPRNSYSWSESMRNLELKWPCICTSKPNSNVRFFGLRNWLASTCDIFNRFMMGPNEEGRCFIFGKGLTAAGIWFHGLWYRFDVTMVTMLLMTLILAITLSSPDFLPMHYFIQIKPYIPSPKGMKK